MPVKMFICKDFFTVVRKFLIRELEVFKEFIVKESVHLSAVAFYQMFIF
jgi:hypothetical protein